MGAACFDRARFGRDAAVQAACFGGDVSFKRVQVLRHARFERTRFRRGARLGPLAAGGRIGLTDVTAHGGLRVHAVARLVTARGATVHGEADFRLRQAELARTRCGSSATARSRPRPAGHGRPHRRPGRAVLADDLADTCTAPDDRLAALYSDLARAIADSGRRRLARDLRYSALEKRRHSEPAPWRRWGLHLLWITCGYGLRAGRVLAWLAIIVALVCSGATLLRHDDRHDAARTLHLTGDNT